MADVEDGNQFEATNLRRNIIFRRVRLLVLHRGEYAKCRLFGEYLMAQRLPGSVTRHARGVGLLRLNEQHVVRAVARKTTLHVEVLRPTFTRGECGDPLAERFE